jgi:hypothetical protein
MTTQEPVKIWEVLVDFGGGIVRRHAFASLGQDEATQRDFGDRGYKVDLRTIPMPASAEELATLVQLSNDRVADVHDILVELMRTESRQNQRIATLEAEAAASEVWRAGLEARVYVLEQALGLGKPPDFVLVDEEEDEAEPRVSVTTRTVDLGEPGKAAVVAQRIRRHARRVRPLHKTSKRDPGKDKS